jgi:hypothetical protein
VGFFVPRYFFHVHDYSGLVMDEEGQSLPDLGVARRMAVQSARCIMAEDVRQGCLDRRGRIEVADVDGTVALIIAFHDVVDVK